MVDELDLAFDDHAEQPTTRHRKAKSAGKSGVAFLMAFILLAVLGGGVYFGYSKVKDFFVAADYDGSGGDPVQVSVAKNATLTDIGDDLVDADVVKSTKAFTKAAAADPRGRNIQSGTYTLRKQMSAASAVALLLDPKARVSKGVTIPEGKTAKQTYELLAKATGIPVAEFVTAGKDPVELGVADWWFQRRDHKPVARTVEGFLFPDTYEFDPKATAAQILALMVAKFNSVVGDLGFADTVQNTLSVSPFEGLIVASLSEAESGVPSDLPKIARVAYNRAYKAKIPLQFDTTANYWLELNNKAGKHSGRLSPAELNDPRNPYNTVSQKGLPVGPINSPGKAALEAAAKPALGPWLFFVVIDKAGRSAFAVTDAGHEKNIQKACANGIPLC
jgi:peptidoglycan lytic transglycosylase G